MCGRYFRTTPIERFAMLFHAQGHPESWASYNIAPSAQVLVARNATQGGWELVTMKWGLVPSWSAEPKTPTAPLTRGQKPWCKNPRFAPPSVIVAV